MPPLQAEKSPFSDNLFKTPPPRPTKALKLPEESAISRRTRSKHPLNDTPLEDLERRLVPPDITDDMYDWGDTDNEDYLAFLKDFLFPGQNIMNEMGDDDEADPEYNVMEDDEDLHDREELRRDRAVKVPKKELNELVAELIEEYHVSSGDDLEDFTSLTSLTPFMMNDSGIYSDDRGVSGERSGAVVLLSNNVIPPSPASSSVTLNPNVSICSLDSVDVGNGVVLKPTPSGPLPTISSNPAEVASSSSSTDPPPVQPGIATFDIVTEAPAPPPPEPLFRELDLQFLQHQMRQHIQLLAQSFVLTVSSEDEGLKKIAKTSKAMVIELKNFATYNGKNSSFAVINLDHAWGLVNGWPHKFLQQSPIKKKILEEKYINESGTEEGSSKVSHFPRHIVKIIAENETFIYKNLLPESFNQKNQEARCRFTFSEDALLVSSLEEMKSMKRSATQMAEIISELLLVVHSQHQVYHRIRNLRKSSSSVCHPDIKKYFTDGILPEPDRNILQVTELVPLLQRDREGLSSHWAKLLDHIEDSSSYRWEEQLNKDPILKSVSLKWVKYSKNKSRKSGQSSDEAPPSPLEVIDQVFPKGVSLIEKPDPDMQAIPLLNASGKPGAIILIPKYAMLPPQPSTLANNSTADREENKATTNNSSSECTQQTSSAKNVCVVGLNHLIRKSRETPRKTFTDQKILPDLPEPTANVQVRCVGKPFELPGLSSSTSDSSSRQVINLATLQTPLKREVFLKVAEQSETMHHGGVDVVHKVWSYEPPSPNVIYEGTESELSSEDSFEGEPSEPPPVVTLSSDTEESMGSPMDAGGDGKGSNSPKKSDSGSCTNKQGNTSTNNSSSNNTTTAVSARRPSGRGGGNKGDDSDDDHDKRPHRKRSLPKDCTNDRSSKEKDEDQSPEKEKPVSQNHSKRQSSSSSCVNNINAASSQMQPPPSKPIASTSQYHTSRSQPKKTRKSPGNQASRRVSKYNVTPADIMIQENSSDFDDVADAYMETYLAKVHSVTEAKNPGLYTAFLQTLMEAGEHPVNQTELHAKVKVLFKDYPDLLREFESLLDPTPSSTDEPSAVVRPTGHEESLSHMKFIQQLDKFTEKCPQLKAKIMNKLKTLKEFPNVGQKDIVTALEPFFITNPVMMEAFKAIFPSVYRPQSVSSSIDFEEIELDLEDPPRDNSDDLHFEVVKLPEETAVPATNTCPCCCHTDTNDPSFKSRSKHCRKCSLKDGKIYVHNGRVMRPVSVELTPVAPKTVPLPIGSGTSTTTTGRPCTALHHDRQKKEPHSHTQAHSSKSKEFKEPEVSSKTAERKSSHQLHHAHPQHHHPLQTQSSCSATKSSVTSKHTVVVEESPAKEHRAKLEEATKATDGGSESGESSKFHKPQQHHTTPVKPEGKKQETGEWTEEEDTIILSTCQQEPSLNIAWRKMATLIPHRSLDLIKSRCSELIALIQTVNEER
ncbi:GON-4-like protein [Orchesella cincta]|uniref:GON-4-like protein n=1 Tax=Orchesella cincta TaxID=48709 RepID=A0A1D2N0W4_ORCCI|nr:GON-4-like protein [Orchesella cincta]